MSITSKCVTISFMGKTEGPKYIVIANELEKKITNNEFTNSKRLPSIRILSKENNVNSITIVNAYKELINRGLVISREGSGYYVNPGIENRPNNSYLDFTGRNSNIENFPLVEIKLSINEALNTYGTELFTYENSQGFDSLIKSLELYLKAYNIVTPSEMIQVISGGQQAIDIISKALIHYGDCVFTEEPTYKGAIDSFVSRDARIIQIPLGKDGIDIKKLEARLKIECPSFIYLMPCNQKPTGTSYSLETKKRLLELANEYNFYIVEDDLGSELDLTPGDIKTLKSMDKFDKVIYIKSFTPLFMPGLRLGFIALPSSISKILKKAKLTSDISTPNIIQRGFANYLNNYNWKDYYTTLRESYINKFNIIKKFITNDLNELVDHRIYNASPIFWLELKKGNARFLEEIARNKGLHIIPGYTIDPIYNNFFRLSVKSIEINRIPKALELLKESILELYNKNYDLDYL